MVNLYYGDCTEIMPTLTEHSVDMILTDLPYGVLNKTNPNSKWDCPIGQNILWDNYKRLIKPNGCIALFAQGKFYVELVNSNLDMFKYDLVWDKELISGFLNAKKCHFGYMSR